MEDELRSRRAVLRGALALGCSWWVPAVLSGCDSKKGTEPTTSAPAGSASGGPAPAGPAPAGPASAGSSATGSAAGGTSPAGSAATGAAPTSSAAAGSTAGAAPAKMSKTNARYQTQPKDGQKCADCLHFVAESNTCKLVEGEISPDGWCMLWTKKA